MSFKANTVVADLGSENLLFHLVVSEKVEMMFSLSVDITSHQNVPYKRTKFLIITSMHSSRMRTACLLYPKKGVPVRGEGRVCLPRGVSTQGSLLGGCLPGRGVFA